MQELVRETPQPRPAVPPKLIVDPKQLDLKMNPGSSMVEEKWKRERGKKDAMARKRLRKTAEGRGANETARVPRGPGQEGGDGVVAK